MRLGLVSDQNSCRHRALHIVYVKSVPKFVGAGKQEFSNHLL